MKCFNLHYEQVLATVKTLYDTYQALCGEELIEQVFLPFLSNIYKEPDTLIRNEYVFILYSFLLFYFILISVLGHLILWRELQKRLQATSSLSSLIFLTNL